MILYSRFYKECIWREKKNKLNNYHDYRWWTKVLVTLTVFAKLFLENYLATIMKIAPNDSELVFVINILTVVHCCLLFSYTNRFSTKKKI